MTGPTDPPVEARPLRILVTGSSGVVGTVIVRDLRRDHAVRGFGRTRPVNQDTDEFVVGSIEDTEVLASAMDGVDAVVHLAANGDPEAEWTDLLGANLVGTRNVFEAARRAGVKRIVFASSNHASGIDTIERRRASSGRPAAAANLYGVSKAFGEVLGHQYAFTHRLSVICLRIGWIGPEDDRRMRPPDVDEVTEQMWISHRDLAQIVRRSLATDLAYGVFYAMSSAAGGMWDLQDAERRLGYRPQD